MLFFQCRVVFMPGDPKGTMRWKYSKFQLHLFLFWLVFGFGGCFFRLVGWLVLVNLVFLNGARWAASVLLSFWTADTGSVQALRRLSVGLRAVHSLGWSLCNNQQQLDGKGWLVTHWKEALAQLTCLFRLVSALGNVALHEEFRIKADLW